MMNHCPKCGPTPNMKRVGKRSVEDGIQREEYACTCGAKVKVTANLKTGDVEEVATYRVRVP